MVIVMNKERAIPSIRFSGFTTNWEQLKLRDISKKIGSGKTPRGGRAVYTDVGIRLLRSQNIYGNRVNFGDVVYITQEMDLEMSNSRVEKNDVLLNITGASIGRTAVYELSNQANVNQHVCIIRPKNNVNSDFVQLNLSSYKGQKQIELNQAGGGREGLNFQQIAKMNFYFPTFQEQSKIGLLFKQVDNTITLQQQLLTDYKQFKKALLQQLFPQKGESVPKIRFTGFSDDWELKELKEFIGEDVSDGDWIQKEHIHESGEYRIVQTGNIGIGRYIDKPESAKYLNQESFDELKANEINPGDILISRLADPAGRALILPFTSSKMVTAVDVAIIRPNKNFISNFLVTRMNSSETLNDISKQVSGTSHKRLSRKNLEKIELNVPNIEEQEKIGQLFKKLDEAIAGHEQKLATYQELKKALLQRMFV